MQVSAEAAPALTCTPVIQESATLGQVLVDLLLFAAFGWLGVRLQRRASGDRLRTRLWSANYVVLVPCAAAYAALTVLVGSGLALAVACGVLAWWSTLVVSWVYARAVTSQRSTRGALTMVGAFPNTGFLGFPLAHLAFGAEGLRLAVIYDQVGMVIPAIAVSTAIARRHTTTGGPEADSRETAPGRAPASLVRQLLVNPPFAVAFAAIVYRVAFLDGPLELAAVGALIGHVIGPVGFLLLGLSVPLHGLSHGVREVLATAGAMLVRLAGAPALLWLWAVAAGANVPPALYLAAAMPTAFHTLVISREHGLEVAIVRLGVVVTTVAAVVGVVTARALGWL
jgi:predicted permease